MMIDYHIHPNFSQDAEGTIEEYCAQAIKLGLDEICFTTHFEIDPKRKAKDDRVKLFGKIVSMNSNWIDYYFKEIENARLKFTDLSIKAGIEIGYDPNIESELRAFLNKYPFDFVLGAIHCIKHVALTDHAELDEFKAKYLNKGPEQVAREYFETLDWAIKSELFNSIAHIDVYKKYVLELIGEELLKAAELFLEPTLKLIVKHNVGIEINTSGLRQNPKEIYPAERILLRAKAVGAKIFTIGSDAHRINHLGFGLKEGFALAEKLGLNLYRFEKCRPIKLNINKNV
jgi:histidinol-phosphatase (PHP family)